MNIDSKKEQNEQCTIPSVSNRFFKGQKVWCYYHFTALYSPPMCGEILFKLPFKRKHHFAYGKEYENSKCFWYFVLMKNGLIILHPETCIDDLEEAIKKHDKNNECPKDPKQLDAWMSLNKWQTERVRFLNGC